MIVDIPKFLDVLWRFCVFWIVFQFKRKLVVWICSNVIGIFLCFLNVVSLHMMPLRAISQLVWFQPHCSNSLFNIKKHKKWKRMLKHVFQFKHKAQYYLNLFKCFGIILCFLIVVLLHMVPLRAISQAVRFQPHCSNNFI